MDYILCLLSSFLIDIPGHLYKLVMVNGNHACGLPATHNQNSSSISTNTYFVFPVYIPKLKLSLCLFLGFAVVFTYF